MRLLVGNRVRFSASFRDIDGRPFDPVAVTVTVTMGGKQQSLARVDGKVHRKALGQFFVDVLVDKPGAVDVKWSSTGAGQEAWQRQAYEVADDEIGADIAARLEPLVQDHADEDPIAVDAANRRAQMIAELRAHGMWIDDSRSDAYVEAAHRGLIPKAPTARDAYVNKRKFGR